MVKFSDLRIRLLVKHANCSMLYFGKIENHREDTACHSRTFGEIPYFCRQLRAGRLDVLRGQLLPISENETLFTLIGNHLRRGRPIDVRPPGSARRVPMHQGNGFILAETVAWNRLLSP